MVISVEGTHFFISNDRTRSKMFGQHKIVGERFAFWRRLHPRMSAALVPFILFAVVAIVFGRSLGFSFVMWDDDIHLTGNRLMHPPTLEGFWLLCRQPFFGLTIPVTYLFWWLISYLYFMLPGTLLLAAWPFHLANLLLHALNGVLLYRLLTRVLRDQGAAVCAALLFVVHPLQVEAVAWVSGAKDLLCSFFSLLALLALVSPAAGSKKNLFTSSICFVMALLAKPSAVALSACACLLPWLRDGRKGPCGPRDFYPVWCWSALALPIVVLTMRLQQADTQQLAGGALWQRLLVAGDALVFYLGKLLVPYPLLADYGRTPAGVLATSWPFGALALLLGLGAILLWLARRGEALPLLGLLLAALALTPVLGLIPFAFQRVSTVADRYAYFPMVGVAIAVGALLQRFGGSRRWVKVAGVMLAAWAFLSYRQCATFKDTHALFTHVLEFNPQSFSAHNNLGLIAVRDGERSRALHHLSEAARLYPQSYKTIDNIGVVLQQLGQTHEAISYHQRAIALEPRYATAYVNLAEAHRHLGERQQANHFYETALQVDPDDFLAHNNFGVYLEDEGKFPEAETHFRTAASLRPVPFLAYFNLGVLYEKQRRWPEALDAYERARAFQPDDRQTQEGLIRVRRSIGGTD